MARDSNDDAVGTQRSGPDASLSSDLERWSFALESAGLGVWDADLVEGRCYYSPVWKAMLGYAEHEIGDDSDVWFHLVHPDDRERATGAGRAHELGLTPFIETEFRMRHKNGHWVWVLDRGKVVERDAHGQPTRMIGVQTDITKQKEAERHLALLNERIGLAVQAGGVGLWHWDLGTRVLDWDQRTHELYGTDPEGFSGRFEDWIERLHPEDAERAQRDIQETAERQTPFDGVYRIIRTNGDVRHVRALARVVQDQDGRNILIGTNWDVTEHVLAAEALAADKERLRITLLAIGDAVICTDMEGRVTLMNAAAETLTQMRERMVVGRPLESFFRPLHEETGKPLPCSSREAMEKQTVIELPHPGILVRRDGTRRSIRDLASPVLTSKREIIGSVLVIQDVTSARALQRELEFAATHDALTGLKCRASFEALLTDAIERARKLGKEHALLYIDLDRFKIVNDIAGHAAGDALLKTVGKALRAAVAPRDVVARLGGDEFAVLLLDCAANDAERVATRILGLIGTDRFSWAGKVHEIGASIGVAIVDQDTIDTQTVLAHADVACYSAKSGGRNRVSVYRSETGDAHRHMSELHVAAGIREAVEDNRFRLYAQEIRDLRTPLARGQHVEILTRMVALDGGIIPPGAFIPAAERFDLMGALDRWVLRTTIRGHGPAIMKIPGLSVGVNLSANSLNDPELWPFLASELADGPLDPARLTLEITETAVINNFNTAERFVAEARRAGCKISLDDFGSGVSSFAYLKRFEVDSLKIDGAFVRTMTQSRYDRTIVRLVNEIAVEIGVETIAECVEDTATVEALTEIGVRFGQGFLFHRPRPLAEVLSERGAEGAGEQRSVGARPAAMMPARASSG
jgi:diguanylate cyclase (GGDEF)-like protein/PAS domain S-box-containing protein